MYIFLIINNLGKIAETVYQKKIASDWKFLQCEDGFSSIS